MFEPSANAKEEWKDELKKKFMLKKFDTKKLFSSSLEESKFKQLPSIVRKLEQPDSQQDSKMKIITSYSE